ncbi:MAG: hypothetical protein ACK4M7_03850, partial [Burkholderiales bacterium]
EGLTKLLKLDTSQKPDAFLQEFRSLKAKYPIIDQLCQRESGFIGFKALMYALKSDDKRAERYTQIIEQLRHGKTQEEVSYFGSSNTNKASIGKKVHEIILSYEGKAYFFVNYTRFSDEAKKRLSRLKNFIENIGYQPPAISSQILLLDDSDPQLLHEYIQANSQANSDFAILTPKNDKVQHGLVNINGEWFLDIKRKFLIQLQLITETKNIGYQDRLTETFEFKIFSEDTRLNPDVGRAIKDLLQSQHSSSSSETSTTDTEEGIILMEEAPLVISQAEQSLDIDAEPANFSQPDEESLNQRQEWIKRIYDDNVMPTIADLNARLNEVELYNLINNGEISQKQQLFTHPQYQGLSDKQQEHMKRFYLLHLYMRNGDFLTINELCQSPVYKNLPVKQQQMIEKQFTSFVQEQHELMKQLEAMMKEECMKENCDNILNQLTPTNQLLIKGKMADEKRFRKLFEELKNPIMAKKITLEETIAGLSDINSYQSLSFSYQEKLQDDLSQILKQTA